MNLYHESFPFVKRFFSLTETIKISPQIGGSGFALLFSRYTPLIEETPAGIKSIEYKEPIHKRNDLYFT